jgi:hypothetical protein
MAKTRKKIVKEVKNGALYDDGTILIRNVRFSYPHLDKPYAGKKPDGTPMGEPAYSLTGLAPKATHKDVMLLCRDEVRRLLTENKLKDIGADKKFIRDGDLSGKETDAGNWTISAREKTPPILRDEDNRNVERADAGRKFYGGCYGDMLIRPWFQSNQWGKRVNANLLAVKFGKDGEPFGEGRITEDDVDEVFGGVADDDDGYDDDEDEAL